MIAEPLLLERTGAVVTLTLNRPGSLNALDTGLKEALQGAVQELAQDQDCRAVVLTGAGRAFCAGQDLQEHAAAVSTGQASQLATMIEHHTPLIQTLATMPKPVIAAVRGIAAGAGASLALLADLRIGGPGTRLLTAFAGIGLAADTAMSWTLPRLVGQAKATELLLLNEPVDAPEAHRLGLLNRLVDNDDAVLSEAHALAARLAAGPTLAYGQIKRELMTGATSSLADALATEAQAQLACSLSADHQSATVAFLAKQPVVFHGR